VDVWFYSGDTGVASAAYLQVAAGVDWLDEPSQTLLRWYVDDVIEGGPMQPQDGVLTVPTGPGLGVTLDPAAFQRAHESFRTHGSFDQYVHPDRPHHYGPRRIAANLGGR
jgi:glucarate dehydratase